MLELNNKNHKNHDFMSINILDHRMIILGTEYLIHAKGIMLAKTSEEESNRFLTFGNIQNLLYLMVLDILYSFFF